MASLKSFLIFILPCLLLILTEKCAASQKYVQELDEDNWRTVLDGQWMIEFYAPWCPACNALAPVWKELGQNFKGLGVKVAAIDVTKSPGLSGRFVVTALPTIFHVSDGVFRLYRGPRDLSSMLTYVDDKKWEEVQPVSAWIAPDTPQMSLVSYFFKMSQTLRLIHEHMTEMWGLPTWACYLVFAVVTIVLGALLGLLLVCIIDLVYPPKKVLIERSPSLDKLLEKRDDGDMEEDSDGDSSQNADDPEMYSQASQSDDTEDEKAEASGDSPTVDNQPRKRRPRKD